MYYHIPTSKIESEMMNLSCQEMLKSDYEDDDMFDRLPDEIVRSIFNKLHDAKSLCSSMAVCKRFHCLAPQVDEICLTIPLKKAAVQETTQKSFFKNVVAKTLMKPLHFISQMIKSMSKNDDDYDLDICSYHVPNEVLKPFQEVRNLHLKLPCHGNQKLGSNLGGNSKNLTTLLKWKAEFGREMHSCVMLGAKSRSKNLDSKHELGQQEPVIMAEEDLKLRIVWMISCLIAASARHYLIQETVKSQEMIQNIVVSDESGQGELCMNREQIEEVKGLKEKTDQVSDRSRVPALRMKMWCLERLELENSGEVLEGATLVVIRPAIGDEEVKGRSDADLVATAAFGEEVLGEAARKLILAKRCYSLEMNSF